MISILIFTTLFITVLNDPIKFEVENTVLTHYFSTLHFHAPWKQKISGFLIFSGALEMENWLEMS